MVKTLKKKKFRHPATRRVLMRLFNEFLVTGFDVCEFSEKTFEYLSERLDSQRYTNDEIVSMFSATEVNSTDMVVENVDVSFLRENLSEQTIKLSIGYIPTKHILLQEEFKELIRICANRITNTNKLCEDILYVLSKVLKTENIILCLNDENIILSSKGLFRTDLALTDIFLKLKQV